jgi:hypothetical protein
MEIAYLVDRIGIVADSGTLRDACMKIVRDKAYLDVKRIFSNAPWYIVYKRDSGTYPTQDCFCLMQKMQLMKQKKSQGR